MNFKTLDDVYKNELFNWDANQTWFFQTLVWLDVLSKKVPSCVIETGTNRGWGAYRWSMFFDEVHTVELSEALYNDAIATYGHVDNITFYNNTSENFLAEILPTQNKPCVIMLDAHASGGDTVFDDKVGRFGSPILHELNMIKEHSVVNNHIILIDDLDDCDEISSYPSKDEIENMLLSINPNYHIELNFPRHLLMSRGTGMAVEL